MSVNTMNSQWRSRRVALLLAGGAALGIGGASRVRGADTPAVASKAVFEKYCFQCHGEKGTAGVSLTKLTSSPVGDNFASWQKVVGVLEQDRMPPKGMPQ